MSRRRVFLTGAAGAWGRVTADALLERGVDLVLLVRHADRDTDAIRRFDGRPDVNIVVGDLRDPRAVAYCVRGSDVVLHVGALVSPVADDHPELAQAVNVGSARNIIDAVRALPDSAAVDVVMIGSVSEVGDRTAPKHWGRVGDPLKPATYDEYAQSKIEAERLLVDSGLPRWVWLRQTGMLHPGVLANRDPIMTHTPLDGPLEWSSDLDSAALLASIATEPTPPELWGRVHNIGGGDSWRMTNFGFLVKVGAALGVRDIRRWFHRRWFVTRNFHGQWFADSDDLHALVPFRSETFDEALARCVAAAPASLRASGVTPAWLIRYGIGLPAVLRQRGTLRWAVSRDEERLLAFYGSRDEYRAIGGWSEYFPAKLPAQRFTLDHGYDEGLAWDQWTLSTMAGVADFRGGSVVSESMGVGDVATPLRWRCAAGHEFDASPRLVLHAGHWCGVCVTRPTEFTEQAKRNRFLAQVLS